MVQEVVVGNVVGKKALVTGSKIRGRDRAGGSWVCRSAADGGVR
jgi:hypothetical protein